MKFLFLPLLLLVVQLNAIGQIRINEPAPEISLPDLNGETISLSSFKGKVVLIDFWASWCGPCRYNNSHLLKFYKKYHPKGLEIIGISVDEDNDAWKKAVQKDKLLWPQLNDNKNRDASSAVTYHVNAIPASFLIDKNGLLHSIDLVGKNLETEVKNLLKE